MHYKSLIMLGYHPYSMYYPGDEAQNGQQDV